MHSFCLDNTWNNRTERTYHNEWYANEHTLDNLFSVDHPSQDGRQGGFKEINQRHYTGRLVLHSQKISTESNACYTNRDKEDVGQIFQRIAREDGDIGKTVQASSLENIGYCGDMGYQNEDQHNKTAKHEAETGNHRPAILSYLTFAHHPI